VFVGKCFALTAVQIGNQHRLLHGPIFNFVRFVECAPAIGEISRHELVRIAPTKSTGLNASTVQGGGKRRSGDMRCDDYHRPLITEGRRLAKYSVGRAMVITTTFIVVMLVAALVVAGVVVSEWGH
jgi:hypothetical protein